MQTELSGTISVSQDQTLFTPQKCLNPWDVQSKHIQPEGGVAEALYAGECRGGGGESYVMTEPKEPTVYCLQGNGIDRADTASCNGSGWRTNESYTLNTIDRPAVVAIPANANEEDQDSSIV